MAVQASFCSKLLFSINARKRWPMYATHEEDIILCKPKWNQEIDNVQIVMHDKTNICLPTASDGCQQ